MKNNRLGYLGMDQRQDNIVKFPSSEAVAPYDDRDDLYRTGAHMVQSLKDEIESRGQMTQGLSFSFDLLLYGLRKTQ